MTDKLQPDNWFQAILMKFWLKWQDWKYERFNKKMKKKAGVK